MRLDNRGQGWHRGQGQDREWGGGESPPPAWFGGPGGHPGGLTLSILAALGRFLGFLVRVTLTKLWKEGDLGGGQHGEG